MFEEVRNVMERQQRLLALDEQLVTALFAPAVNAHAVDYDVAGESRNQPKASHSTDALIEQLLPLSEFYQEINAPLSAAIWGIGNSVSYMRRQRSLVSILFETKRASHRTFIAVKGLLATAAIQFSDGTASTVVTSNAMQNLSAYQAITEQAIRNLTSSNAREA